MAIGTIEFIAPVKGGVKSRGDTVGLFIGHDEQDANCSHWSREIGSRTHLHPLH
jgi:hypothetical protein